MEWENDICYTLRDGSISDYTTNQSEARWIYDVIITDESTESWLLMNGSLKLVKVINHQCVILDDLIPPRSSSDFGRGRKKYTNCREYTAG